MQASLGQTCVNSISSGNLPVRNRLSMHCEHQPDATPRSGDKIREHMQRTRHIRFPRVALEGTGAAALAYPREARGIAGGRPGNSAGYHPGRPKTRPPLANSGSPPGNLRRLPKSTRAREHHRAHMCYDAGCNSTDANPRHCYAKLPPMALQLKRPRRTESPPCTSRSEHRVFQICVGWVATHICDSQANGRAHIQARHPKPSPMQRTC
jgi:hypothetical protein